MTDEVEQKIDTDYTEEIVCPYCGFEYSKSNEFREDNDILLCDECGEEFEYNRIIHISYCTSKIEDDADIIELNETLEGV